MVIFCFNKCETREINDKDYCDFILRKIKNEPYEELVKLFIKYLPSEIHIC